MPNFVKSKEHLYSKEYFFKLQNDLNYNKTTPMPNNHTTISNKLNQRQFNQANKNSQMLEESLEQNIHQIDDEKDAKSKQIFFLKSKILF